MPLIPRDDSVELGHERRGSHRSRAIHCNVSIQPLLTNSYSIFPLFSYPLSFHQAPEGEEQPSKEVDLAISNERIQVLNADSQVRWCKMKHKKMLCRELCHYNIFREGKKSVAVNFGRARADINFSFFFIFHGFLYHFPVYFSLLACFIWLIWYLDVLLSNISDIIIPSPSS